ncbi:cullin-3B-like [Olea europaea var. sylvestris]|uniref:cullin-3B-like n=1 Tax=Olea europaea var. sylvestris TaxID=158386 RepID=UPI000C1D7405|nr:cullin-3B-like [Olea europaea var. sylvestris]
MSRIYDNWERLVRATLKREEFRELARAHSRSPSVSSVPSDFSSNSPFHDHVPESFLVPQASSSQSIPFSQKRNFQLETFKYREVGPEFGDTTWKILDHAFSQIYNRDSIDFTFAELYSHAYNMVLHKYGEKLYSGLESTMTFHLQEMCKCIEAAPGVSFLEELNTKWADHNNALRVIRNILMYMDRTYVPSTQKTPVLELGLNLWRDNVIHSSNISIRLLYTLLDLIYRERTGEGINRELMRNTIKMLVELGSSVYQEDFEKPFIEVSSDFYRMKSQEFIESSDCGDYLKEAERCLEEEIARVLCYLEAKSEAKIISVVEKEMIANHMLRLLHMENSGLINMLLDDKYDELSRMYSLFRRVPNGLSIILDVMTPHIRNAGRQLVTDPEKLKNPVEFVDSLLEKKDKYDKIISSAFNNDETFQNALNSSFEYFINLKPHMPEYASLFVDDKLHEGLRVEEEEEDI